MKREFVFFGLFFGLFLFLFTSVSAADNLCLDDTGWDVNVVHSPGSPSECPSIPNSPNNVNDGNQNTVSMGCRMNDNYDYPVEITFPSVVPLITRVSYNYSSSMAYKSYPSIPGAYSKVELFSEGAWVEAVGCVVLYEGNSVIPYVGGINNPRAREECVGSWSNVEKIKLIFSAQYGCCPSSPGPFSGYVFLEEVGAYGTSASPVDCGTYSATLGDLSEAKRLYRFWDTVKGDTHFYTAGKNESVKLMTKNYPQFVYEGVSGFVYEDAAGGDRVPLYRFFNNETFNDVHLYTINETEKMLLESDPDWELELSPGYVYPCSVTDSLAFNRYYNSVSEDNFYTTNLSEKDKFDTTPFAPWNQYAYQGIEAYLGDYGFEDESQIILSLNGSVGALGSLWDAGVVQKTILDSCIGTVVACNGAAQAACEGNSACTWIPEHDIYAYPMHRIYYDEIFGVAYTGANPHDCTGSNNVVDLSANMNALVSPPDFGGLVDVCYGNLSCVYVAGGNCPADYECVVTLYDDDNSHLADCDSFQAYDNKVCCKEGGGFVPDGPSVLEWRDTEGNVITNADVGDTVVMVMTNSMSGTFEILEADTWPNPDDEITSIVGVVSGSDIVASWTISENDLDNTNDYGEFYFTINGNVSGYFAIDIDDDDDEMNIEVVSPGCGENFDELDVLAVNVTAKDGDDFIYGNVSINGVVFSFGNGGIVFNYVLNAPGNVQVIVDAVNTRGERGRNFASIMVLDKEAGDYVDGDYVAACIDEPEDFKDIPGTVVKFDASSTRAIKVIGGAVNYIFPGDSDLDFFWGFFPDGRNYGSEYVGTGSFMAYNFTTTFAIAGDNSALLRAEVN